MQWDFPQIISAFRGVKEFRLKQKDVIREFKNSGNYRSVNAQCVKANLLTSPPYNIEGNVPYSYLHN